MIRYYISPVVGDGTRENPYRPALAHHGLSFVAVLPMDNGRPRHPWCLCQVNGQNHGPLIADKSLSPLPDVSPDVKYTAIGTTTKQGLENALLARGVMLVSDGQTSYREVIRQIGRALAPDFDENNFSV